MRTFLFVKLLETPILQKNSDIYFYHFGVVHRYTSFLSVQLTHVPRLTIPDVTAILWLV